MKSRADFNQDWTYAALCAGYMAAAKSFPAPAYENSLRTRPIANGIWTVDTALVSPSMRSNPPWQL